MRKLVLFILGLTGLATGSHAQTTGLQIKTSNGIVEGVLEKTGVRSFKGVPFAAPPVGDLRWKEPQPAKSCTGVRKCDHFAAMGVQPPIYSDMMFRASGINEDCLYLNLWVPASSGGAAKGKASGLPVLVYFFGGGFVAGDGSEGRYDGEGMATKGIIAITVTYRLGVFGFLAHPELTQESSHHASGNYGLLDQSAALRWVKENIRAFGGDPDRVTIAGESAGSVSVSAQMVSPLSKGLINGAIGESGSLLGALPPVLLDSAEQAGIGFAKTCGVSSLAELRAMPADKILDAAKKFSNFRFPMTIDGYFLPKAPAAIFQAGEQAHVPLLAGWNSDEGSYHSIIGNDPVTRENYERGVRKLYGSAADTVLKLYSAATDGDVEQVATDLASDRFIAFSTWRWANEQAKTGGKPVYRYYFERARPEAKPARGAVHSAEIEYALGNLPLNKVYSWTPDDYAISALMQEYFANFIKKGDPNGPGLPVWPAAGSDGPAQVMHINVQTRAEEEKHRERYLYWDRMAQPPVAGTTKVAGQAAATTATKAAAQRAALSYQKIHDKAIVVDTHNDVLTTATLEGLDIEKDLTGRTHSDLARLKKGGVDVQVFSIFCDDRYGAGSAFRQANREIDSLYAIAGRNPDKMEIVKSPAQLDQAVRHHKLAAMMGVEGGHMMEDNMDYLDSFYNRGVRYMTLTWNNSTSWATSALDESTRAWTVTPYGLTQKGKDIVRHMNQLGMLVDLSHVGEQTFRDAIHTTSKPVLVSHSSVYALCPVPRNLKDDQIKAVGQNGGVIMVNFYSGFLDSTYGRKVAAFLASNRPELDSLVAAKAPNYAVNEFLSKKYPNEAESLRAPLSLVIDHIDYIAKLIGADHVGLGSDFDGIESPPKEMDDVTSYPLITRELLKRGYSRTDVEKILGGNFIRVYKANAENTK